MPRKLLGRFLPNSHQLKKNKSMSLLGEWMHDPNLWHLNRRSVSGGVALGLFAAWIPVPLQMLVAAALAVLLRVNLPISVVMVWVTNPLTIAPMFYFAYRLGVFVLGVELEPFAIELSLEWISHGISTSWKPFLLGCLIMACTSALAGFVGMRLFWRYWVLRERGRRLQGRNQNPKN